MTPKGEPIQNLQDIFIGHMELIAVMDRSTRWKGRGAFDTQRQFQRIQSWHLIQRRMLGDVGIGRVGS